MKKIVFFLYITLIYACSPKGPQTFDNPFVGKSKEAIIEARGNPTEVRVYDQTEICIYRKKEECFKKNAKPDKNGHLIPYKTYHIEQIYYVSKKGDIYKYQVWRKRID